MDPKIRILVTGAGAPGTRGTVYSIKKGAADSGLEVDIYGVDCNIRNSGLGFFKKVFPVVGPEDTTYHSIIEKICISHKIDLILPQTTREIQWFSNGIFDQQLSKVLVNNKKVIDLFNDKISTTELFRDNGFPYPDFQVPRSLDEFIQVVNEMGYPRKKVVVKLAVSNGMRGIRILNPNPWNYETFIKEKPSGVEITLEEMVKILSTATVWPRFMVCEYLDGDEYSVDCYRGESGGISIPRKRNVIRTGISFETTIERNKQIIDICDHVARIGNLSGVFGFQFKMNEGIPKILECNPRVQGTMIASLLTKNNIIWAAISDSLYPKVPKVRINHSWDFGSCYRYWGAVLENSQDNTLEII